MEPLGLSRWWTPLADLRIWLEVSRRYRYRSEELQVFSLLHILEAIPKFVFIDPGDSVLIFSVLTLPLKLGGTASDSFCKKVAFPS